MNQFRQKFKRADKNPVKDVVLAVTYQCNSRCRFCHIWKNKEAYSLFPIDYKNLPRDIKNVNISGGEPFLRRDLPRIIRVISRQCPQAKIIISTNGFSPSLIKKQIQEIIKFKRDIGVAVSIDGFGRVHEELRRFPGGFCLALETVRLLKELGLKTLRIAFTLGDQNINQLKKVYRLSRELGVEFSLAAYHNSSHYFRKQDNQIKNIAQIRKELNWLITRELNSFSPKRWLRAYFAYGLIRFLETKQRILPDYSGSSSLFIDPFGRIYPSDVWNLEIGRLQRINDWNKFIEIIKGITLSSKAPAGWMLCTARQSMRKHWFKVGQWILNRQTSKANIWLSEKFSSEQLFPFSKRS